MTTDSTTTEATPSLAAQEAFHRALRNYGGRLDLSKAHPTTRSGMEELSNYYRWLISAARFAEPPYNPTGDLIVDFVDNAEVNAVALGFDRKEFIGINWGLVALIYQAFYVFMSRPSVLSTIGKAEVEKAGKKSVDSLLQQHSWKLMESLLPADGERLCVAQHLAWNAMAFVFAHEVSHVCRAHLRFLKNVYDLDHHIEYKSVSLSEEQARALQSLELDADTAAAETNMILWTKLCQRGTYPLLAEISPLTTWSLSLAMLFHVLDMRSKPIGSPPRSHPEPAIRLLQVAYEACGGFDKTQFPEGQRRVAEGWGIVSKWWQQNGLSGDSFGELDNDLDGAIDKLDNLRRETGELVEQLRPLTEERNCDIRLRKEDHDHTENTEPNKADAGDASQRA